MEAYFTNNNTLEQYAEKLKDILNNYEIKTILPDGSVKTTVINDDYLLVNDSCSLEFFMRFPQFEKRLIDYKNKSVNHIFHINFDAKNPILNLELKCLYKIKIFSEEWAIYSCFQKHTHRYRIIKFMELYYPAQGSLKELDIDKAEKEYFSWLLATGLSIIEKQEFRNGRKRVKKVRTAQFLRASHNAVMNCLDDRPLWVKDIWKINDFVDVFDFDYNKSAPQGHIKFDSIKNQKLKQILKEYIRDRLLSKRHMGWHSAQAYVRTISSFFNIISPTGKEKHPLRNISREDVLSFIEWTRNYYAQNNFSGVENHLNNCMGQLQTFFEELQSLDHPDAPRRSVRQLINPADFPKYTQHRKVTEISDFVLEQLFNSLQYLHPEVIPIVWLVFKTGLRIGDVLTLTNKCLVMVNSKPYLETDISKTKVKSHRIPIDNQLADILRFLITKCDTETNLDNNPHRFLFSRTTGPRRGRPFLQGFVREQLNGLAHERHIVDEHGELYTFRMHEFRHTYAVKLLNNGTDFLTVQELLAHASPEMTMVYAQYTDDSKRKEFERVLATGTFEFNTNGVLTKINPNELDHDSLDALWQDHKLNAIDNPYGTCVARLSGKCPFIEEPPCLSCNNGAPCKDLAIGLSELDMEKYQLHIKTIKKTIGVLNASGREDIASKNQKLLEKYEEIEQRLDQGDVIYDRSQRLS